MTAEIFTIGHSNFTIEDLVQRLQGHQVRLVCDVRAKPRSRRNPQFHRAKLSAELANYGIDYQWYGKDLGGFRTSKADSPHAALAGTIQGFADHMDTENFANTLAELLARTHGRITALMCAEADHQQCHRRLISDYLTHRLNIAVQHIVGPRQAIEHQLSDALDCGQIPGVYNRLSQMSLF
ncbi:MAG: DUF488 domain-containing protein [Pseudomonadota bacterium]